MAEKTTLQLTDTQQRFIEDMAYLWEKSGGQRMTGRILGWLLICDPPEQSAGEIAEAIGPVLFARGLLLIGLDVIGEHLTEINVTSPTCFQEIFDQTGFDVATLFVQALEAAQARTH